MIYSAGMPLLYVISMIQIFCMYWVDKYLCKLRANFLIYSLEVLSEAPKVWTRNGRCYSFNYELCPFFALLLRLLHVFKLANLHIFGIEDLCLAWRSEILFLRRFRFPSWLEQLPIKLSHQPNTRLSIPYMLRPLHSALLCVNPAQPDLSRSLLHESLLLPRLSIETEWKRRD